MKNQGSIDRVLLVDDDADDRMFFKDAVSEINPEVICELSSNGKEALIRLNFAPLPNMIFLDLNMPVMNGLDCLNEIKNSASIKDIPVIIFTTTSDQNAMKRSYEMGAAAYFRKPNDFPSLMEKLKSLLTGEFKFKPLQDNSLKFFAI